MSDLNWIKEIDWESCLSGELKEVANVCGIDTLLKLWQYFGKTSLYISEKPLDQLKRKYILKHRDKTAKELARMLNTSEMFVYNCISNSDVIDNQADLFNNKFS